MGQRTLQTPVPSVLRRGGGAREREGMAKIIGAKTLDDALWRLGAIAAEGEARGERTLVFCEDRLTLLAERAVLSACGGTFLTEVTTFARFLSGPGVLSKEGSVLEISALLTEYEAELKCFRPRAAQAVYETIAQLSASRVTAEMLRQSAESAGGALGGKLQDLALLFEKYGQRLNERGLLDENGYLALLPEKLSAEPRRENIVFFGFRSFTKQALEGVRAALCSFRSVTGIFLAGGEELYTNEAAHRFRTVCEEFGGAETEMERDSLSGEAALLRQALFAPGRVPVRQRTDKIRRFTAADEAEELNLIAALIKKHIFEGARYRDITVLLPESSFLTAERVFGAYRIPFFADKKRAFSEHPFCTLVTDLLLAVSDGVLPDEADAIASNYYFGRGDEYRNYLLRYGGYRGGVRREIRADAEGFRTEELAACREKMLSFLGLFPRKGRGKDYTAAIRALRKISDADKLTERLQRSFTGAENRFLSLDPLEKILAEIETVAGDRQLSAREFCDGLKGALSALEISMIPQSLDAVFVGELTESKFCRTPILFAGGLTDDVPRISQDTAIITDGEMASLAAIRVEIEPAIAQVNARARESLGLNLTAFTQALYLSRPLRRGREETGRSEIFSYIEAWFDLPSMPDLFPFDCCERQPATLKLLALKNGFEAGREEDGRKFSTLYALLNDPGLFGREKKTEEAGRLIFSRGVSPSLLERYFECPYAGFARSLRLVERPERPILDTDTGNLIHAVLEAAAARFNSFGSEEECREFARETALSLLSARFGALSDTAAGQYTGRRLCEEAEQVTAAAYRQLAGSAFRVANTEEAISLSELLLSGKADRIDFSDDYVRVIDYKTGKIEDSAGAYYTGRKLQLELYLRAAAKGKRAAGAFYFPAADNFTAEGEPKFRMTGFYCGDEEVISRMDKSLTEGTSLLFKGGYDGSGMPRADFEDFLDYSLLVSKRAEDEMRAGNIAPSPFGDSCTFCKMKSLCGFIGEPRRERAIKCGEIAGIVRRERGEK